MKNNYAHELDKASSDAVKMIEKIVHPLELSVRFSVEEIANIPSQGRGIIVMNHGALPLDALFLVIKFFKNTGRIIRPLVSKNMRKHRFLRECIQRCGGVDANGLNALKLLERDELILLYPGGPQEGLKEDSMQYRLIWEDECGFVKLALMTSAPIIPTVTIGLDDNLTVLSDGKIVNELLFGAGSYLLPIVGPKRLLPKKVTCYVGKPIEFAEPPEATSDKEFVKSLQSRVKNVMEDMIAQRR